ncbi:unnamed protein product [Didymodactylos carnosus]|uniref:Phosphoglycerate mutase n=1 Tax=Didymodactylos carnosus TaxID=1234261 RepID=A0A814UXU1_9BILA|nr:unnamed protein product [Didymodactylos carnosus]CAF1401764.1 unnamed protein product [Didymodactylos carnosus]CAF3945882.1 unnamed protein product [Didymodactylos carnosus]CAF4208905.1 unnamed protein product [Didymodactylos carnosus]
MLNKASQKKSTTITSKSSSRLGKTLYLIRHGQSTSNRDYCEDDSYRDAPLSDKGIAQAKAIVRELELEQIELILVSPLTRALQTCTNAIGIYAQTKHIPVIVLPQISEIISTYYSCGRKRDDIEKQFPTFDWSNVPEDKKWWWPFETKGSETHTHVTERIAETKRFISTRQEKRIAVFSHGDFLYDFMGEQSAYLANCQWVKYEI